jgi:tight adherence protein C
MLSAIAITFLVTICVVMVLMYAFSPQAVDMRRRLSRVLRPPALAQEEELTVTGGRRAANIFASIGKILPASKAKNASRDQVLLIRAGYRREGAVLVMRGVQLFCCVGLTVAVIWTGTYGINPIVVVLLAAAVGWLGPEFWLASRVKARQKCLQLSLPDAMDLLVICVEVGLGLDQALLRVAEEMQVVHLELSAELHLVNLEMRVGKTRIEALRELAKRTGLEDIKSLVGILAQTDRFGTSIVQALRSFSEELRTKRRQRAEELSAKVSVKMVPALVFFIFPALMVVILGPAVLTIMRVLLPTMK